MKKIGSILGKIILFIFGVNDDFSTEWAEPKNISKDNENHWKH